MKILIEMRWIRSTQIDGISRFTLSIVAEWLRIPSHHQFVLMTLNEELTTFILNWLQQYDKRSLIGDFEIFETNLAVNSPQNFFKLKKWLKTHKPDIFYSPYYHFYLPRYACTVIGTVHDLIPLRYPKLFNQASLTFKLVMRNQKTLKKIILGCDKVITISQNTRQDLKHLLGIPEHKIRVVHLGASGVQSSDEADKDVLKHYHLSGDKKYITCVSRHEPYKNIITLIRAYAQLPLELRERFPLLLVGAKNTEYTPTLLREIQELNLTDFVYLPGSVDTNALPVIYQNSILYVCPSLYEGFGLPVLEAMSFGVPVLAANTSSLPEVLGEEGGILFEPQNIQELTQKMTELLTDEQELKRLSLAGLVRASEFTWKKTASHLMTIFNESFEL